MMQQVEAIKWDSGIMNSTGLGLSIDIDSELFMDRIIIADDSIYIMGLRSSDGALEKITMNSTETINSYDGPDLPYFSYSSDTRKLIDTNMLKNMTNSTIIGKLLSYDCIDIERITYTTGEGTVYVYDGPAAQGVCAAQVITLNQVNIDDAQGEIKIVYAIKTLGKKAKEEVYPVALLLAMFSVIVFRKKKNAEEEKSSQDMV